MVQGEWPCKQPLFIISAVACRWFAILSKQTAGEKKAYGQQTGAAESINILELNFTLAAPI